jgi:actin, other eukaryote
MLVGKEMKSFPELVYSSIMRTDIDIRKSLYENIVLSGGTTMFPGLAERLAKDLVKSVPSAMKVKVISS